MSHALRRPTRVATGSTAVTRCFLLLGLALFASPLYATSCKQTGVGDPCIPEQEYNTDFNGFDEQEVNVESKSFTCQTRLCLVNHFRGRVSCPYGQDENKNPPRSTDGKDFNGQPVAACVVPGTNQAIEGNTADTKKKSFVSPQCSDRTADKAVYCSCRCANIDGKTDDGANYCTCPDGFACEQLVTSIGQGDTGLTGAYCIKNGSKYVRGNACSNCLDPTLKGGGQCP
jgi:hypothetical protein